MKGQMKEEPLTFSSTLKQILTFLNTKLYLRAAAIFIFAASLVSSIV